MKVRDLKEHLDQLPEGAEVFLSSDAEGNSFAELEDYSTQYINRIDVFRGRLDSVYHEDDLADWEPEEIESLETVVVLWPM